MVKVIELNHDVEKNFLCKIFVERLSGLTTTYQHAINSYTLFPAVNRKILDSLINKGKVVKSRDLLELTEEGRRSLAIVMCGGTFDIIHPGHISTLKSAKSLGDVLIAIVATDETVERTKGRKPHNNEDKRLELVSSLRFVDLALIGQRDSIYDSLLKIRPNYVVLGYDQTHNEEEIRNFAIINKIKLEVIRLTEKVEGIKSSSLLKDKTIINET